MIRRGTLADIKKCKSIAQACGNELRSLGIDQWTEEYPSEEILIQDIEKNELFVLEIDQEVIGMIVLNEVQDPEYAFIEWTPPKDSKNLVVHRLAVNPTFQGKGYAQQLMTFAEDFAKSNDYFSIRLDTFSQNKRNQKFYEQRGYKRKGETYLSYRSDFPYVCFEYLF